MHHLQISAKTLGHLAPDIHCPRCSWIRLHQKRLPWQIFPSIFSSIDAWTKRLAHAAFACGRTPAWLAEFGKVVELLDVPHWSRFKVVDAALGITLTGVPDELVRFKDGSLGILDYKTARYSSGQDALLPLYEIQLNTYRHIAQRLGMGQVSTLGLIYFEPVIGVSGGDVARQLTDIGAAMPFETTCVRLPILSAERIEQLLVEVRQLHDKVMPPSGRDGCRDCASLDQIINLLGNEILLSLT